MARYAVIGAGAAGISALEQLRKAGYDADIFEKTDRVGGHWHTDYDSLHLISSRNMTTFEDFPMPDGYPHFPRRDLVAAYIESYAREHNHYNIIRFNSEVKTVVPVPTNGPTGSAGWTVTLNSGESSDYDGVLVANGHLWDPKVPLFPGEFTGKQIHSGSYRNTNDIDGARVLVVGAGNSGCDLSVDAAQSRIDVDIVIRTGIHFQSKTYFGVPRQELKFLADYTPDEQDLINRLMARLSLGESDAYPGMPTPLGRRIADGPSVANDLLLYWIHHGRIRVVPEILRFDGKIVYFSDGSNREYDTILWATGFRVSLPFLDQALVKRSGGIPIRYGAGIVPDGLEKLYYIGLTAPRGPMIPIYGLQAKLVVEMIALHEQAGAKGAGIAAYLAGKQADETSLDINRDVWDAQLADTRTLLSAHPIATQQETESS